MKFTEYLKELAMDNVNVGDEYIKLENIDVWKIVKIEDSFATLRAKNKEKRITLRNLSSKWINATQRNIKL